MNKIYVISDIHGEYDKMLRGLYNYKYTGNEEVIVVGDIMGGVIADLDILKWIRDNDNVFYVQGNHDVNWSKLRKVWTSWGIDKELIEDNIKWLKEQPMKITRGEYVFVHGYWDERIEEEYGKDAGLIRRIMLHMSPIMLDCKHGCINNNRELVADCKFGCTIDNLQDCDHHCSKRYNKKSLRSYMNWHKTYDDYLNSLKHIVVNGHFYSEIYHRGKHHCGVWFLPDGRADNKTYVSKNGKHIIVDNALKTEGNELIPYIIEIQ